MSAPAPLAHVRLWSIGPRRYRGHNGIVLHDFIGPSWFVARAVRRLGLKVVS